MWLQAAGYNTYYTGKLFNAHTVDNYNSPHVAGWNGSDFLLDPYTYSYLNSSYQRNYDPPVSYEGQHTVDILTEKAYDFLADAVSHDRPFFLGVAPVAPHSNVEIVGPVDGMAPIEGKTFSPPVPAERHKHLFKDMKVPRTDNFNPDEPSGANWVRNLPKQSQENVDFNDHFYRSRLRALQAVDELVEGLVTRLDQYGVLENTYIIYTTDNGYHIGQHRLQPGKECSFEEDINIPLIIRGPDVPHNLVTEIVTTHTDLAPTILDIARIPTPQSAEFDGEKIPLTTADIAQAAEKRHEHVNIEFWGFATFEGRQYPGHQRLFSNNTYKALRIISDSWDLHYSVWCNGEHELYDLKVRSGFPQVECLYVNLKLQMDPGQLRNLLQKDHPRPDVSFLIQGYSLERVAARLDALLFVLKSCKGDICVRPWLALHPQGNVLSLRDALSPRFDYFYEQEQVRIAYSRCELGYILESEGPQFETEGLVYRDGFRWSEWV